MADVPLLYGPGGRPIAVQMDQAKIIAAQKDAVLVELWGLINGEPNTIRKWGQVGGLDEAFKALSVLILELIGKEVIEQRLNCTIQVEVRPDALAPTATAPPAGEIPFVPAPVTEPEPEADPPGAAAAARRWFRR